jgi:hypothetical protein
MVRLYGDFPFLNRERDRQQMLKEEFSLVGDFGKVSSIQKTFFVEKFDIVLHSRSFTSRMLLDCAVVVDQYFKSVWCA